MDLNMPSSISLLLLAAGNGVRINNHNKAFLSMQGQTLLQHAINSFMPFVKEIICGVRAVDQMRLPQITAPCEIKFVEGGETRHLTIQKTLSHAVNEWVMIHDVARPFVTQMFIQRLLSETAEQTSAIAPIVAYVPRDTLLLQDSIEDGYKTLPRQNLFAIQTPQLYRREVLQSCYRRHDIPISYQHSAVSILEFNAVPIRFIQGEARNQKITYPEDLALLT
jgi:2-C-methyl-D-erythritol 4-phosphate cytidylyltransferase